jgi:EmrB/QacA subfamily drug resistance transporter
VRADSTAEPTVHKWWTLAVVALGVLLVMADSTIVTVALPSIREDLGYLEVSLTELQWVVNAYVLTFAALLLTAGRLADLFGRRLIFVVGLVVFIGSSIACGVADDIAVLIAFRGVQGVGAALLAPTSLSIITATFPPQERGMAIGIWSGLVGFGVALGPLLGGLLAENVDWRWIFYINIPVGIAAFVGAFVWVRESRDPSLHRRLDLAGVVTSGGALFALTFGLLKANEYGWADPRTIGLLAAAVAGLILFIVAERFQRQPMLDLKLFRSATFSGANATAVLVGFALFCLLFFGTLFTQTVMGYSAVKSGATLLPMMVLIIFLAPMVGRFTDRLGPRWPLAGGMGLLVIACLFLARLDFDADFWDLLPALLVSGVGFAMVLTPLTAAALAGVPPQNAAMGAAVINTTRQAGGSIGLAVLGAISVAESDASLRAGRASLEGFVDGFSTVALVAGAVALVGAVVAAATVARGAPAAASPAGQQLRTRSTGTWAVPPPTVAGGPPPPSPRPPAAPTPEPEPARPPAPERPPARARPERPPTPAEPPPAAAEAPPPAPTRPPAPPEPPPPTPEPEPTLVGAPAEIAMDVLIAGGPAAGDRIAVGYEPVVFGRSEVGDGRLGDDPELSRRHASLSLLEPGRLLVEDLDSTNGTFVNDHRIDAPTIVETGDVIRVGTTTLHVIGQR